MCNDKRRITVSEIKCRQILFFFRFVSSFIKKVQFQCVSSNHFAKPKFVFVFLHTLSIYTHMVGTQLYKSLKKKTLRRLWSRNYPSDLLLVFKYHTFGHKLLFSVEKSEYLAFDLVIFLYLYAKLLVYRMQIYM